MAFDPDKFMGKDKAFDPDAFIKKYQNTFPDIPPPSGIRVDPNAPPAGLIPSPPRDVGIPIGRNVAEQVVYPTIEGLGTMAGAAAGMPLGPAAMVGGSALGYGITKEMTRMMRGEPAGTPEEMALRTGRQLLEGAAYEAGGQVLARGATKALAGAGGAIASLPARLRGETRAANIAKETLGDDLPLAIQALRRAPEGATAAEATADLNLPVWQSLLQRAERRNPTFFGRMSEEQKIAQLQDIARVAGGETQTAARRAAGETKAAINERLIPVLEENLEAANIAGVLKPQLEAEAQRFGQAAAQKVEDVRRFTAAGERAGAAGTPRVPQRYEEIAEARKPPGERRALPPAEERVGTRQVFPVEGMPRVPVRYTYMGELAERAERVAAQAAQGSLAFGEASRFAQAAADSLADYGLKPLTSQAVIDRIGSVLKDPKYAGNRDVSTIMSRVASDLKKWTDENGVIDAWAIDSIRKNSINQAVQKLYPSATKDAQKRLAADVARQVRPLLVKAVEDAGGTGYGKYLADYAESMNAVSRQKMGAEALDRLKNNPDDFVKLVKGDDPDAVEKIFGPGEYDIVDTMGDAYPALRRVAGVLERSATIKNQQEAGREKLREIMIENAFRFRIPPWIKAEVAVSNRALDEVERKIGRRAMDLLTNASMSADGAEKLLSQLPPQERLYVLRVLSNPNAWFPIPARGAVTEATGIGESRNRLDQFFAPRNELARQAQPRGVTE
jgi:hypothetical protein